MNEDLIAALNRVLAKTEFWLSLPGVESAAYRDCAREIRAAIGEGVLDALAPVSRAGQTGREGDGQ